MIVAVYSSDDKRINNEQEVTSATITIAFRITALSNNEWKYE
jgi:hypothetical protein